MARGFTAFKNYAITQSVHNGQSTIEALRLVYEQNKGSKWDTIIKLFKTQGQLNFLEQYNKDMGYK
jgi:hypothetical protein